jgi:hypothetical protein
MPVSNPLPDHRGRLESGATAAETRFVGLLMNFGEFLQPETPAAQIESKNRHRLLQIDHPHDGRK